MGKRFLILRFPPELNMDELLMPEPGSTVCSFAPTKLTLCEFKWLALLVLDTDGECRKFGRLSLFSVV